MNNNVLISGKIVRKSVKKIGDSGIKEIMNLTICSMVSVNGKSIPSYIPVQITMPGIIKKYRDIPENTMVSISGRFETYMKNEQKFYSVSQVTYFQPVDCGSLNHIMLWGRITENANVNHTDSGIQVISFIVANSRSYKKDNEWKEVVSFIPVTAWKDTADADMLKKGAAVWVSGRLSSKSYTNKNGQKIYLTEVIADSVISGGSGKRNILYNENGMPVQTPAPASHEDYSQNQYQNDDDYFFAGLGLSRPSSSMQQENTPNQDATSESQRNRIPDQPPKRTNPRPYSNPFFEKLGIKFNPVLAQRASKDNASCSCQETSASNAGSQTQPADVPNPSDTEHKKEAVFSGSGTFVPGSFSSPQNSTEEQGKNPVMDTEADTENKVISETGTESVADSEDKALQENPDINSKTESETGQNSESVINNDAGENGSSYANENDAFFAGLQFDDSYYDDESYYESPSVFFDTPEPDSPDSEPETAPAETKDSESMTQSQITADDSDTEEKRKTEENKSSQPFTGSVEDTKNAWDDDDELPFQ